MFSGCRKSWAIKRHLLVAELLHLLLVAAPLERVEVVQERRLADTKLVHHLPPIPAVTSEGRADCRLLNLRKHHACERKVGEGDGCGESAHGVTATATLCGCQKDGSMPNS